MATLNHIFDPKGSVLDTFKPIGLSGLDQVALLNRQDTKLVINSAQIPPILSKLLEDYYILEIDGKRNFYYSSLYYDSEELDAYKQHHNGRMNRYKIRYRGYMDTGTYFFEIKFKSNKNRTIKTRIRRPNFEFQLSENANDLVKKNTFLNPENLHPSVWINFNRITLASVHFNERVTIDTNLVTKHYKTGLMNRFDGLSIIEVKQNRFNRKSKIIQTLRDEKVFPLKLSKYCLAILSCYPNVKRNRFKSKLKRIAKLTKDKNIKKLALA